MAPLETKFIFASLLAYAELNVRMRLRLAYVSVHTLVVRRQHKFMLFSHCICVRRERRRGAQSEKQQRRGRSNSPGRQQMRTGPSFCGERIRFACRIFEQV